jgi:hypothetical protein
MIELTGDERDEQTIKVVTTERMGERPPAITANTNISTSLGLASTITTASIELTTEETTPTAAAEICVTTTSVYSFV